MAFDVIPNEYSEDDIRIVFVIILVIQDLLLIC